MVDIPGLPGGLSMTWACVKYWIDSTSDRITLNKMIGLIIGIVILRSRCQGLAPSSAATSYISFGTPCRAAR
jgi:hypothetical protein